MTNTELKEPTQEIFTVDVDNERQIAKVSSCKFGCEWTISKLRSQQFFKVDSSKGKISEKLSGKYTSLESAITDVVHYIKNTKENPLHNAKRLYDERKNAKLKSEDS